eukprot:scaffold7698_cov296-Pinguiococcus_pyrenoidosus.AAC.4
MKRPVGLKRTQTSRPVCPCCFSTWVSDSHSHTSTCLCGADAMASQSPLAPMRTLAEDAVRVADDKHLPAELGTDDFAALLPNKEAPHRLPPLLLPSPSLLRPLSRSLLPSPDVHCGVPRHRVHRVALEPQGIVEPSPQAVDLAGAFHDQARHHGLSMARQHHRATMLGAFPPHPMQTQRHVVSRRHERARVAAPDAAADDSLQRRQATPRAGTAPDLTFPALRHENQPSIGGKGGAMRRCRQLQALDYGSLARREECSAATGVKSGQEPSPGRHAHKAQVHARFEGKTAILLLHQVQNADSGATAAVQDALLSAALAKGDVSAT